MNILCSQTSIFLKIEFTSTNNITILYSGSVSMYGIYYVESRDNF